MTFFSGVKKLFFCGAPTEEAEGACCPPHDDCYITTQSECEAAGGRFLGADTECDEAACEFEPDCEDCPTAVSAQFDMVSRLESAHGCPFFFKATTTMSAVLEYTGGGFVCEFRTSSSGAPSGSGSATTFEERHGNSVACPYSTTTYNCDWTSAGADCHAFITIDLAYDSTTKRYYWRATGTHEELNSFSNVYVWNDSEECDPSGDYQDGGPEGGAWLGITVGGGGSPIVESASLVVS